MPRRVKEEGRTETIIHGLLKEPDNRRCINCNSLEPQYVCTTFWTFVCKNCSRVHREFTHRVKSVSTAKFNEEEIMALQAGGNERAKEIYFKTWDPQYNSYPDSSNLQRLREFVNLVYVDRRYAGDNRSFKLPRVKSESRDFSDWPSEKPRWGWRGDYLGRSAVERSSSSDRDESYNCDLFERSSSSGSIGLHLRDFLEERNPRNTHEMPRSRSHRNRSPRIEIVDDRFREDGSVKRYERNTLRESGSMSSSPASLRNTASLPIMRPLNEILGDQVPQIRVTVPSGADDQKAAGGPKAADATVSRSTDEDEKANEPTNCTSLIDFSGDKAEQTENESSSTAYSTTQASAAIVPINSVESLWFELSPPVTASSACTSLMLPCATATAQLTCTDSTNVETTQVPRICSSSEAPAITVISSDPSLDKENTYPMMQDMHTHQPQPPSNTSFNDLESASSVESLMNEQSNGSSAADDLRRRNSAPVVQSIVQAAIPSSNDRNGIPEELFTSGYPSSFIPDVSGWQMNLPHRAGYATQFHPPAMPLTAYPYPPKPKNPFDFDDDGCQVQAATVPCIPPFQGNLPNALALPSQAQNISPYGIGMNMPLVPGAYMAQPSNNVLFSRPEGNAKFGRSEDPFASLNTIQRESGANSFPAAPTSSLSRTGNPFG